MHVMTPSEINFTNTPNGPSTKPPHDLKIWHQRFGQVNHTILSQIAMNDHVIGLNFSANITTLNVCEVYLCEITQETFLNSWY